MLDSYQDIPEDAREAFEAALAYCRAEYPESAAALGQVPDLAREDWARLPEGAATNVTAEQRAEGLRIGARRTVLEWVLRWEKSKSTRDGKKKR